MVATLLILWIVLILILILIARGKLAGGVIDLAQARLVVDEQELASLDVVVGGTGSYSSYV